jgi:AcrR family transcriptional regulator
MDKPSTREAKRLQTRERLLGAAIAEFKRCGLAAADVGSIVTAAGVAHGTFFFHFPTKEHVLLELERREEKRIAARLAKIDGAEVDLEIPLREAVDLITGLERRLGPALFKDFLALHFSLTRPPVTEGDEHPVVVEMTNLLKRAQGSGRVDPDVDSFNSAVFFLLGLYALLTTTNGWPEQTRMVDDYVRQSIRSLCGALAA